MSFKASTICFTSYKGIKDTTEALHEDGCQWFLYGEEVCPNTGRLHLQGMANHKKTIRWTSMKKLGIHIEKCMDPIKSIEYCSKDLKTTEFGKQPVFDKKTRACKVKDVLKLNEEDLQDITPREYVLYKKVQGLAQNASL